ncbi:MAG: NAD-dependent epimerase/dehydratase family protein [Novosphingobium sp.]
MRIAITGAAGFVGRSVGVQLRKIAFEGTIRLLDRNPIGDALGESIAIDLCDLEASARALDGIDRLLHLASMPGLAAEADPAASRCINLDVSLGLIERMAGRRVIFASSIAVFGSSFGNQVDDETPAVPDSVYGTHKRMVELFLSDAVRRGAISGMSVRLPGIVARPASAEGFGSAFLSDVFPAVRQGKAYTVPVARKATSWLMSGRTCAANLVHALLSETSSIEPVNLPAVRVEMGELVTSAGRYGDARRIGFADDPAIRKRFAAHPPLTTANADRLGFRTDGTVDALVDSVFSDA